MGLELDGQCITFLLIESNEMSRSGLKIMFTTSPLLWGIGWGLFKKIARNLMTCPDMHRKVVFLNPLSSYMNVGDVHQPYLSWEYG